MVLHNISVATMDRFRGAKRRHAKPFIESELRAWLAAMKIKTLYIEPASPWLPNEATPQRAIARITNGYIESLHARFREECLNREQLWTLTEARVVIEDWRWLYNNVRPTVASAISPHGASVKTSRPKARAPFGLRPHSPKH